MLVIRNYRSNDYEQVRALYEDSSLYGGQYDEARDSKKRLQKLSETKPENILVAETNKEIIGTVTLFEDGRSAWLYRFAVKGDDMTTQKLWEKAKRILIEKGHTQILVYAPAGNHEFEKRYTSLGFTKGNNFSAYWQDIA